MSKACIAALMLWIAGCGDREVALQFHTPAHCPALVGADAITTNCPMRDLGSMLIEVERPSGEVVHERCFAPRPLCNYEDMRDIQFLSGIPPSAGVEVRITGYRNSLCLGESDYFCCDSPGEHLVDLSDEVFPVDLWCSCAPRTVPCSR